ncbi:laccase domain-containing protein [Acidovorax sp. sif1233]|uniref:polyphenol oxidase family protein n=1 Tax=Acidovorax sp. sif1233 TaxID=2854792 RepID=UPI001C4695DF|nr:laccase domain-containing protein [Acidovorax sp. sif1233]MBV7454777.1 laccase domain-containing protein [Acidovorax sp. sif1233]
MTLRTHSPQATDWLVPDWPLPPGVHALCTTRAGGVSLPPYDSLNLGTHVGDDPAAVRANRLRLQSALEGVTAGTRPVFLSQVHGDGVVQLDGGTPNGIEADACVAAVPAVACTIMVADCLPVLFAHRSGRAVAAAHAGWRGLAGVDGQGVLESVFKRFVALAQADQARDAIKIEAILPLQGVAQDTLAWLGPCIGPQAFEVGPEVRAAFCDTAPALQDCFAPSGHASGKYLCDLAGLARRRLQALGITHVHGNDGTPPWCTVTNASRFFSHRRDSAALGGSGRFAACIWRG